MKSNKLVFISIFISTMFVLSACDKDTCNTIDPKSNCACYEIYEPVCGCNDVTYSNDCKANCAGVTEFTSGESD